MAPEHGDGDTIVGGLGNGLVRQVAGNYLKTGGPVTVVFGHPVEFDGVLDGPEAEQRISERALDAVRALGEEERIIRATLT